MSVTAASPVFTRPAYHVTVQRPGAAPTIHAAAPPTAGHDAGSVGRLGGGINLKNVFLYGAAGAVLGAVFPIIPGGPIGGALIGAVMSLLF